MWCQLFSEPGAGSDAAAVRTSAKRVDGGWEVTGQKVWTSLARQCQWGLATVRTDPDAPKHAGVTMMAIDMNAPGVEVKPLREITGDSHFNEVFFDGVFVPDSDVVGDVNRGWLVARATLGNERISIGGGSSTTIAFSIDDLVKLLDGVSAAAAYVRPVGKVIAHFHTLRLLNLRRASRAIAGAEPGPEGNVTKLVLAEQQQRLTELGMELAGTAAVVGQMPRLMRVVHGGTGNHHRRRNLRDLAEHHRRAHSRAAARSPAQVTGGDAAPGSGQSRMKPLLHKRTSGRLYRQAVMAVRQICRSGSWLCW